VNVVGPPVRIDLPYSLRVVRVAAGGMHSFAIDSTGDVWGWGLNLRGQIGIRILADSCVVEIARGEFHSMFLPNDGRVFTCRAYDNGQLAPGPGHILASVDKVYYPMVWAGIAVSREVWFSSRSCKMEKMIGIETDSRRSMAWTESQLFGVLETSVNWDLVLSPKSLLTYLS